MFPLLLQTIISNQMRPQRLRGAWFSRLLRHPARRQSGSILSPGTTRSNSNSSSVIEKYSLYILLWHNEMQQGPEFFERVLQWRASNQYTVVCVKTNKRSVQKGVVILEPMGFVHSQHCPADVVKKRLQFRNSTAGKHTWT